MFHPTIWLAALAGLLFRGVRADDSSTYPEWVTNDYNCGMPPPMAFGESCSL